MGALGSAAGIDRLARRPAWTCAPRNRAPIIRAGAVDRVLGAEEVAEALRAWFSPCDVLECAELQLRLGEMLDSVLRSSGTKMGNIQLLDAASESLHVIVHGGCGDEACMLDRAAAQAQPIMTRLQGG